MYFKKNCVTENERSNRNEAERKRADIDGRWLWSGRTELFYKITDKSRQVRLLQREILQQMRIGTVCIRAVREISE